MSKTRKPLRIDVLEARVAALEHNEMVLTSAVTFLMTHLKQTMPSPILGGEPKVVSMLELYKAAREAAQKAPLDTVN